MPSETNNDIEMTDTSGNCKDLMKQWKETKQFNENIIIDIYKSLDLPTLTSLEVSRYLEEYLWPNYSSKSSKEHLFSILCLVNEKARQNVPLWSMFKTK